MRENDGEARRNSQVQSAIDEHKRELDEERRRNFEVRVCECPSVRECQSVRVRE